MKAPMKPMKSKKGAMPAGMYADGGKVAMVKKVAKGEVKKHEAEMHGKKFADGGMVGKCHSAYGKNMKK